MPRVFCVIPTRLIFLYFACGGFPDPVEVHLPIINPSLAIDDDYTAPYSNPLFDPLVVGSNVVLELPDAQSSGRATVTASRRLCVSPEMLQTGTHCRPPAGRLPTIAQKVSQPSPDKRMR